MDQLIGKMKKILDELTNRYLKLNDRVEILEQRASDNEVFVDKELDERDITIEELKKRVAELDARVALMDGRIRSLEQPVFKPHKKPTIPWKPSPAPTNPPWNPTDPYSPSNPYNPVPSIPPWNPPVNPLPSVPTVPHYEPPTWCTACGLNQKNAGGYCCMRVDCPSKGGVTVTTTTIVPIDDGTV
jgi:hypothetical protein